jgi:outer membrane protein assembly factor BamB
MSRRGRSAAGCVAVVCSLLSGCWGQIGFDSGHSRFNNVESGLTSANVTALQTDWSVDLRTRSSEPMVRAGRVYLTTADTGSEPFPQEMHARALDTRTGRTVWDTLLESWCCLTPISFEAAPATLVGDEVWTAYQMIGTWDFPSAHSIKSPVRLAQSDGSVIAGEDNWPSSPAVESGSTVVQLRGTSGLFGVGLVVRDKATLAPLWQAGLPVISFPASPPAVVDGQIFVVSGPFLLAFPAGGCGAADCAPTWNVNLGGGTLRTAAAASGGDKVYVTTASGELIAVNRSNGQVAWRSGALGAPTFDPAVANGRVHVIAGSTLSTFAADGCGALTCAPVWTAGGVRSVAGGPLVAGGVVYASAPGGVKAFAASGCGASSCPPLTSVPVAGDVRYLTVAEGRLFVTSENPARLTALSPH